MYVTDGWMNAQTDRQTSGWTDNWTDWQTNWWAGRWVDGHTNQKTYKMTEWILCGHVMIMTVSERVVMLPEPRHSPKIAWCNYNITWSLKARNTQEIGFLAETVSMWQEFSHYTWKKLQYCNNSVVRDFVLHIQVESTEEGQQQNNTWKMYQTVNQFKKGYQHKFSIIRNKKGEFARNTKKKAEIRKKYFD